MVKLTWMFPLVALIVGVVLPVLPAESQTTITTGTGTGILTDGKAGVTVKGRHSPGLVSGCPLFATVCQVIADTDGDDVVGVPVRLGRVTSAPNGGSCI